MSALLGLLLLAAPAAFANPSPESWADERLGWEIDAVEIRTRDLRAAARAFHERCSRGFARCKDFDIPLWELLGFLGAPGSLARAGEAAAAGRRPEALDLLVQARASARKIVRTLAQADAADRKEHDEWIAGALRQLEESAFKDLPEWEEHRTGVLGHLERDTREHRWRRTQRERMGQLAHEIVTRLDRLLDGHAPCDASCRPA